MVTTRRRCEMLYADITKRTERRPLHTGSRTVRILR